MSTARIARIHHVENATGTFPDATIARLRRLVGPRFASCPACAPRTSASRPAPAASTAGQDTDACDEPLERGS